MSAILPHLFLLVQLLVMSVGLVGGEEGQARDSTVYPFLLNPWAVSRWTCMGLTVFTNTNTADLYTFEVDLCFLLALAGKLAFPWLYTFFTGHSLVNLLEGITRKDDLPVLDTILNDKDSHAEISEQLLANMTQVMDNTLQRRTLNMRERRTRLRKVATALGKAVRVDRRPSAALAPPMPGRKIKRFKIRSRLSMRD